MEAKSSNLKKIRKAMEKTLDSKRFEHTLGVEYTAAALAMRYGEDLMKAQTACQGRKLYRHAEIPCPRQRYGQCDFESYDGKAGYVSVGKNNLCG